MQNHVGKVPPKKVLARCLAELARLRLTLARHGVELTSDERQRRARMRPGGEAILAAIADLAENVGVSLPVPADAIRKDLALKASLKPIKDALLALDRFVSDTELQAEHEAWSAGTAYYTALQRLGPGDARIEDALRPIVEFFSVGRRVDAPPT